VLQCGNKTRRKRCFFEQMPVSKSIVFKFRFGVMAGVGPAIHAFVCDGKL
jgi:hypothetical protein